MTPYYDDGKVSIWHGDALAVLKILPSESVQCCITSPPYWGLRDYKMPDQMGLEKTPEAYVEKMVAVFRDVRRVLRKDGTLWLNLGDTYASVGKWGGSSGGKNDAAKKSGASIREKKEFLELKSKDLVGIPWRVAFALQADGWWLRSDIIWAKPNPMPESVTDRPTKAHEYLFLLTKSQTYYYDAEAIKEPIKEASIARLIQDVENQEGSERVPGKTNGKMKAVKFGGNNPCPDTRLQSGKEWNPSMAGGGTSYKNGHSGYFDKDGKPLCGVMANKKSVWTIPTMPFKEAHFATFPPKLIEPCVLAGSKAGDLVMDCFYGAGTTALVAKQYNRHCLGIELNKDYIDLSLKRLTQEVLAL